MEFRSRLKKLRKDMGLTQKELAEKTGIGQTAIANYESGKRYPDQARLVKIADLLETTTDNLLGRNNKSTVPSRSEARGFTYQPSGLGNRIGEFMDKAFLSGVSARGMILELTEAGFSEEQIILDLLSPALVEGGKAWAAGRYNEAMEHQLSMTAVDSMMLLKFRNEPLIPTAGRAALLTAAGEQHNIGIRMLSRFLELDGWNCSFLGSSVPAISLKNYVRDSEIELVMISVTMNEYADSALSLTSALKELEKPPYVMVGGTGTKQNRELFMSSGADYAGSEIEATMAELKKINSME